MVYIPVESLAFDNRDSTKAEVLRTSYQQSMEELRKEKVHISAPFCAPNAQDQGSGGKLYVYIMTTHLFF